MASLKYSAVTMAKWRAKNPEKVKEWAYRMRNWRRDNPKKRLLGHARTRAKMKGLKFSITEADITPLPKRCPVFGFKLNLRGGKHTADPRCPTLDRIDNKKGYVRGNVIVVSWRANNLKRDATMQELKQIVKFYGKWRAA